MTHITPTQILNSALDYALDTGWLMATPTVAEYRIETFEFGMSPDEAPLTGRLTVKTNHAIVVEGFTADTGEIAWRTTLSTRATTARIQATIDAATEVQLVGI